MRATLAILLLAHSSALLLAPLRCVSPPTSHAPRMAIPDEVAEVAPLRNVHRAVDLLAGDVTVGMTHAPPAAAKHARFSTAKSAELLAAATYSSALHYKCNKTRRQINAETRMTTTTSTSTTHSIGQSDFMKFVTRMAF